MYPTRVALLLIGLFVALVPSFVHRIVIHGYRAEREVKRENKLLVKEWERNQQEVEKEKKRMGLELQKGKFQAVSLTIDY
ncbi:hypothetical protein LguiB_020563 [Lonicera macranthoides]